MAASRSDVTARRFRIILSLFGSLILVVSASATALAHDPNKPDQPPATPEPVRPPTKQQQAAAATGPERVLIYGPTANGLADTTPNIELTVWDAATWSTKTTADFAAFDAIVFGDQPRCFSDPAQWATAVANQQVWSAALSGNIIINGTDPDFHGKTQLVQQSVQFAGGDPASGPGLYVSLSCAYENADVATAIPLLSGLGQFVVRGETNCPIDAHKVADHPTLVGIDDTYLSNWNCSAHEVFDTWPADFQPLAIIKDALPRGTGVPYTSPDGQTGYVYMLARGAAGICSTINDADGDCLTASVEAAIGTSDSNPDTDGDGLMDSWEVGSGIPGNGFHVANRPTESRDSVFGPYGNGDTRQCAGLIGKDRRIPPQFACLNRPPDPLHKDVFVELDWLDCSLSNSCAELPGLGNVDPMHHAPSIAGLSDVVAAFAASPPTNPDGRTGINLRILVDEGLPHHPNCDQNQVATRDEHFGTVGQDAFVLEDKANAVRYALSGHSSAHNDDVPCPAPSAWDFLTQGGGLTSLPEFDHTPFGDANLGGRDILITLGPLWGCPASAVLPNEHPIIAGVCFRKTLIPNCSFGCDAVVPMFDPGIFPAKVSTVGGDLVRNQPIHRLIGEREADALRQLWARSFMHLLGHSIGLPEASVQNKPAPAGIKQDASHRPLPPLPPDSFTTWANLALAPTGDGLAMDPAEAVENYEELASTDLSSSDADNDGVLEGADNCPGVWNPGQEDMNRDQILTTLEFGDACDDDADGDGLADALLGSSQSVVKATGLAAATAGSDPFPFDTDNDGIQNPVDPDDDADGIPDTSDNCRLVSNNLQRDTDGDQIGDACDLDADGDSVLNLIEVAGGSNDLLASSVPEFLGAGATCTNGIDDDRDGVVDQNDPDCVDADGDTVPNARDDCPAVSDSAQIDSDANGIGDACEVIVRILGGTSQILGPGQSGTVVYWSATAAGTFQVRLGGTDCTTGTVIDSGTYDPGIFIWTAGQMPAAALTVIQPAQLVEGPNPVRVCVTSSGSTASAAASIVVDMTAPSAPSIRLDSASDTGSSSTDGITDVSPVLTGASEPNAVVTLKRGTTTIGSAIADSTGVWSFKDTVADGTYGYAATATDQIGNTSTASAQVSITVDRILPVSALATLPSQTATASISIPFTSSDDRSGVASAELWARYRATSTGTWGSWTLATTVSASPFSFGFPQGAGFYEFYSIAIDRAGNREAAPSIADATTQKTSGDTTPPTSVAGPLGPTVTSNTVSVPYTASDNASGVASVELWVRSRVNEAQLFGTWTKVATRTSSPFTYTFANGDGNYEFYTIAIDGAGNREAPPANADAATRRDAVNDPPDFRISSLTATKACTGICTNAIGPGGVVLNGSGTAVDDRSNVTVAWRLYGVATNGTSRTLIFDFKTISGTGDARIESFTLFDNRAPAGYKWYDVEIRASVSGASTSRTTRILITTGLPPAS